MRDNSDSLSRCYLLTAKGLRSVTLINDFGSKTKPRDIQLVCGTPVLSDLSPRAKLWDKHFQSDQMRIVNNANHDLFGLKVSHEFSK